MFKKSFVPAFLLFSFIGAVIAPSHAQQKNSNKPQEEQDDVVRVSTTLVTVPVTIKDRKGKPVLNLKQEDFRLYEDGVEQDISYFETPEDPKSQSKVPSGESAKKPLTVALLLDNSDSTEFKLKEIQDAAIAFIEQMGSEGQILVVAFDKNVRVLTEPTSNRNTLREAISRMRTGGGTSLYDAVDSVIAWLNRVSGRKAIVLFTDGVDTASLKGTYNNTVRAAEQLDAAVYPIQYNTYADFVDNPTRQTDSIGATGTAHMTKSGELASEAYKRATIYLRLLAAKTGGRFEYTDSLKNLSRSFTRIASELRQQYTLGYYPKKRTEVQQERMLKVHINTPNLVVRTRKSYVYRKADR